MPAKKSKKLKVWVSRANSYHTWYLIRSHGNIVRLELSPEYFHRYFFKLKPGAGPVKCEISIRRKE